jgi:DnaK suppressor protein
MEGVIKELEASVISLKERMETVSPDLAIGRISRMDSLVNQGTVEMALAEESKKLNRLRDRIQRLDDPDFGRCALCNEWIPIERLKAAPDRGVCVPCMNARNASNR